MLTEGRWKVESKAAKMWYRSRTLLVSFLGVGVAVVTALATGVTWENAALAGFAALHAVIRVVTTERIAWYRKELSELNEIDNGQAG